MERSNILKWLFIGLAVFLFIQFGMPLITGKTSSELQPWGAWRDDTALAERAPEERCVIEGDRFRAELSTRGGSLRDLWLTERKYHHIEGPDAGKPINVVSNRTVESRMPMRTDLRAPGDAPQQVPFHDLDWKLSAQDGKSCTFTYTDEATRLTKVVSTTGKPYELTVDLTVENLAAEPRKHRMALEQTTWRKKKETEGSLGRISEWVTETIAATTEKTERHLPDAFEPGDFKDPEFTPEKWRRAPGDARWIATSSSYVAQVGIPIEAAQPPSAETQIEERWTPEVYKDKAKDPDHGHFYRSRLAYPEVELPPQGKATYKVLTFHGPKERDVLAALGHGAPEVINLGWFSPIAKILVSYLYVLYRFVGSWGWAICLLTITVRMLLFPLSLQQIKSTAAMRKLKPEMDAINERYKDDTTQRGLATQELWRKHKVNPVVGCFPLLLQMPVWFALYTALQTAVELYHTPFGPVIPDLSAPGKYYIIPIVLGASSFIQQRIMPPQGDPMQQKMMMYMMPAIFTVMMLFLPAGLGVYMLTNTWLGIGQQVLVERYLRSREASSGTIEVRDKTAPGEGEKPTPALGKGKARVRG